MKKDGAGAEGARGPAWLGLAILAVALLNGIGPFLRRTGLAETELYERFWTIHTRPGGYTTAPFGLGRRCVDHRPIEEGGAPIEGGGPPAQYVLAVRRWEVPLKALKDLLVLGLVGGSLVAALAGRSRLVPLARAWPALALGALVVWQAAAGLARGQPLEAAAGLRGFAFLGVAVAAGWVTNERMRRLVPWLLALLAVQLLLAPVELLRGIPIQGHGAFLGEMFARRAAGTFVMPNTLGLFAAAVVALAAGFGATRRERALAWGLGGLVVVVSGSGAGLVALGAAGVVSIASVGRRGTVIRVGLLAAFCTAAAALLLQGRSDLAESVAGRVAGAERLLDGTAAEVLAGRGLGPGTNAAWQLRIRRAERAREAPPAGEAGESAVSAIGLQTGLVGLALYVAALAVAFARNPAARPLVVVLALGSLVLSVPEAFPLNLLLGLGLALPPVPREGV